MAAPEGGAEQATVADVKHTAADAGQLPARRGWTQRAAARWEREAVVRLLDERLPFDELGSLTDRARLRDQVLTDLAVSRRERVACARSQSRRGWSR